MDPTQPIFIILYGSNYILWAQAMHSFIKGEPQPKFDERLDVWDNKNHQIITWFCNTSVPSVYQQFGRYNTAKEIWDLLAQRYTTADLAHQYQLHDSLHRMKQEPDQSINSFLFLDARDLGSFGTFRTIMDLFQRIQLMNAATAMSSAIRLCRKIGAGHFPKDCPRNPEKCSKNTCSTSAPTKPGIQYRFKSPSHYAAADDMLNDSSSSTFSVNDVVEIDMNPEKMAPMEASTKNVELPVISLSKISSSINNFSIDNKLGEGGFGAVYKDYVYFIWSETF
ncbi:hypothetical protein RJ639_003813 [Escallonia herrerae]|uniref:Uncharacterized protein n=1 Tax=Escallonia herrerae TaxID=1293975 RepID=A0AA89AXJ5_9ASTE|nr:hypothetical protein RJ639_003813 [Escallonia herrerae]